MNEQTKPTPLPDSGSRSQFNTGAQRDAMLGKGLPHHIPTRAMRRLARRYEDGAAKYSAHNWRKGIPLGRYVDGLYRHVWAFIDGCQKEDHLGAVIWNAVGLSETWDMIQAGELPQELDDLKTLRFNDRQPDPLHDVASTRQSAPDPDDLYIQDRIYIAGPMRGKRYLNFYTFIAAEELLRNLGCDPVNPARTEIEKLGLENIPESPDAAEAFVMAKTDLAAIAARDLRDVCTCSGILLLDGWQNSAGALAEYHTACWLGLDAYEICDHGRSVKRIGKLPAFRDYLENSVRVKNSVDMR